MTCWSLGKQPHGSQGEVETQASPQQLLAQSRGPLDEGEVTVGENMVMEVCGIVGLQWLGINADEENILILMNPETKVMEHSALAKHENLVIVPCQQIKVKNGINHTLCLKVVTRSWDGVVKLWNVGTGKVIRKLTGAHRASKICAGVQMEGEWEADIWDANTGKLHKTVHALQGPIHLNYSYWWLSYKHTVQNQDRCHAGFHHSPRT
ncbi:hypothetical protein BDR04DRAFT_1112728 [Suillus decipiens]|nr:hypothetical protein BDR04DRAFT_1112728 [Suillus decipiens]